MKNTYTYDIIVNGVKTLYGITLNRIEALKNKGYTITVINKYIVSDNDYNSIAIKTSEY